MIPKRLISQSELVVRRKLIKYHKLLKATTREMIELKAENEELKKQLELVI